MKELEKKAVQKLLEFYKLALENSDKKVLRIKAEEIQSEFIDANPILDPKISQLIARLVDFYIDTGIKSQNKEEIKKIIEDLKKWN